MKFLVNLMESLTPFLTHFLSKNIYNDILCINGSKVTGLNVFYHSTFGRLHYLAGLDWTLIMNQEPLLASATN